MPPERPERILRLRTRYQVAPDGTAGTEDTSLERAYEVDERGIYCSWEFLGRFNRRRHGLELDHDAYFDDKTQTLLSSQVGVLAQERVARFLAVAPRWAGVVSGTGQGGIGLFYDAQYTLELRSQAGRAGLPEARIVLADFDRAGRSSARLDQSDEDNLLSMSVQSGRLARTESNLLFAVTPTAVGWFDSLKACESSALEALLSPLPDEPMLSAGLLNWNYL